MASAGESDVDPSESGAKWRQYLRAMGPGLITGASDDDPSGIATYAHAGSKYGLSFLWAALLSIPTDCSHLIIPRSWVRSPPALLTGVNVRQLVVETLSGDAIQNFG